MKRTFRYLGLLCLLVTIPVAALWATWEGNAGTGSSSDFPDSGLYALSDMFPRNTIVEITNLETGSTVRAVITGSSGVAGLVAVLAPETASALHIREGAVVRVRITTPPAVSERPAPGTLATEDALVSSDPDVNPEAAVLSAGPLEPLVPLAAIADASDTAMVPVEDALAGEEDSAPGAMMEDAAVLAGGDDAVTASDVTPEPEAADSQSVLYDEPELVMADVNTADADVPVMDADVPPAAIEAPVAVIGEPAVDMEEEITLEPAEPRPPETVAEQFPVVPPVLPPAEDTTAVEDEKPVFAAIAVTPEKPAQTVIEKDTAPAVLTGDYRVIDRLEPGKYYVQIAVYKDSVNVREVYTRFGKKYPVAVQRSSVAGSQAMKVLIGPVNKDEYGAVLEYFQKNGFKAHLLDRTETNVEYTGQLKLLIERANVFSGRDMHVTVVANPVAGGFTQKHRISENRQYVEEAVERVKNRPVRTRSCSIVTHFTNAAGHAGALAKAVFFEAEKDKNPSALYLLITAGGDGTSLEAQSAFTQEVLVSGKKDLIDRVCFIRMPFGTGNDATDGRTLDQTLALLTGDAYFARQGAVNLYSTTNNKISLHAFNIASIGLDAFVTHMTNKIKKMIPGNFYRIWVDAACIFYNRLFKVDLMTVSAMNQTGELVYSHEDKMVLYAMGVSGFRTYGSNQKILPDSNNVCGVRDMPFLRKLKLKKLFRLGAHSAVPETMLYSANKIVINYNRKILAQVDGESHLLIPSDFPVVMECTEPFITILKL